jgi:hypothetical protein
MCIAVQPQMNHHSRKLQDLSRIIFPTKPIKSNKLQYSYYSICYSNSGRDAMAGEKPHFLVCGLWKSSGDRGTYACSVSLEKVCE